MPPRHDRCRHRPPARIAAIDRPLTGTGTAARGETTELTVHGPLTAARDETIGSSKPARPRPPAKLAATEVTDRAPMTAARDETIAAPDRAPMTAARGVMTGAIAPHVADRTSRTTRRPRSTPSAGPLPPNAPSWRPPRRRLRRSLPAR